jgi:hypothetical protein
MPFTDRRRVPTALRSFSPTHRSRCRRTPAGGQPGVPAQVYFGVSASTGGSYNVHQIAGLTVTALPTALPPITSITEPFTGAATTPNVWAGFGDACLTAGGSATPATSLPTCGTAAPVDAAGQGTLQLTTGATSQSGTVVDTAALDGERPADHLHRLGVPRFGFGRRRDRVLSHRRIEAAAGVRRRAGCESRVCGHEHHGGRECLCGRGSRRDATIGRPEFSYNGSAVPPTLRLLPGDNLVVNLTNSLPVPPSGSGYTNNTNLHYRGLQ